MDQSIVKVLQAVQEEFPPKRPSSSSSGARKSPPLAQQASSRSASTPLPSTTTTSADRPESSTMAGISSDRTLINEDRSGEMQYDKQGHQNTTTTTNIPSKVSPKPTFMQLPPKSHMNSFGGAGKSNTEFGMRGSDNLMLTPARDDLTFILKKRDEPLAAL